ncbi:MAG: flagellar biosynthesis protein FlhA, partial [Treponemataceae bacterium]|nr:flagellar biosynthesis protein FlhA [Treponemataceae bacterium]
IAPLDELSLELGLGLLQLVDKEKGAELLERITRIRRESLLDLGLVVPPIRIIDNMRLEPNEYSFKIKGVEIGKSKIRMGCYMCMDTGGVINKIQGEATVEPAFNLPAIWVTEDKREEAERSGYSVIDPPTIIATHLTELIKKHASEILGRQEVKSMLDALKEKYPAVVEEVTKIFSMGQIQKVLQGLLKEQVSIRNMVVILETISDFGGVTKDTFDLVEKVRQALGRQICLQYADDKNTLHVFTVEPAFLSRIVESGVKTVNGPIAALEINEQRAWLNALSGAVNLAGERGFMPVILCPQEARALVKVSSERELPQIVVLSIQEIAPDIKVEMIGEIRIGN